MSKCTYVTEDRLLDFAIEASDGLLSKDIYCTTTIGGIKEGTTLAKGTSYSDVFEKLFNVYQAPELTVTLNPSTTLYEKGVDSLSSLKITATITKKSNPIKSIKWYMGSSELGEYTVDNKPSLPGGGPFDYSYSGTISNDVTIKVVVTDSENKTVTKEIPIKFVGMSYYGILPKSTVSPTIDEITNMNTILKDTKKFVYSGITTPLGKVCIAYPSIFGELTSIKDLVHNIDYSGDTFVKSTITINNLEYYCYIQKNAVGVTNGELTFA